MADAGILTVFDDESTNESYLMMQNGLMIRFFEYKKNQRLYESSSAENKVPTLNAHCLAPVVVSAKI